MASTISGDLIVTGQTVLLGTVSLPAGNIGNSAIAAAAGVEASKLQHQHQPTYGQIGTAVSVAEIPFHSVQGAVASLESFSAGSIGVAVGAATVTIDIKKNGTTCLSGVITLDTGNTTRVPESGTITVPAGVAGDLYTLVIVATAGGGTLPTGLFVRAKFRESADA